jgi:hypothetical protein
MMLSTSRNRSPTCCTPTSPPNNSYSLPASPPAATRSSPAIAGPSMPWSQNARTASPHSFACSHACSCSWVQVRGDGPECWRDRALGVACRWYSPGNAACRRDL